MTLGSTSGLLSAIPNVAKVPEIEPVLEITIDLLFLNSQVDFNQCLERLIGIGGMVSGLAPRTHFKSEFV